MKISSAIIPLAGRATRLYPASKAIPKGLFPFIDKDGLPKPAIQWMVEECVNSGIEQVILVTGPETGSAYSDYFNPLAEDEQAYYKNHASKEQSDRLNELKKHIVTVTQDKPLGLGHAVYCAKDVVGKNPFAVMLGDHIYYSHNDKPCFKQVMETAEKENACVYGVKTVPTVDLKRFGIIGGEPISDRIYQVKNIMEKPSAEDADKYLRTPGLVPGIYLAHFGLYCFVEGAWDVLSEMAREKSDGEMQLTDAQIRLHNQQIAYAVHPNGVSLDYGVPEGLAETQKKLSERYLSELG